MFLKPSLIIMVGYLSYQLKSLDFFHEPYLPFFECWSVSCRGVYQNLCYKWWSIYTLIYHDFPSFLDHSLNLSPRLRGVLWEFDPGDFAIVTTSRVRPIPGCIPWEPWEPYTCVLSMWCFKWSLASVPSANVSRIWTIGKVAMCQHASQDWKNTIWTYWFCDDCFNFNQGFGFPLLLLLFVVVFLVVFVVVFVVVFFFFSNGGLRRLCLRKLRPTMQRLSFLGKGSAHDMEAFWHLKQNSHGTL